MISDADRTPNRIRQTAIDIHVPELTADLARWRDATVAVATRGVPPHITLLYPWRTPPLSAQDLAALRAAVAGFAPFAITFSGLERFSPTVLFLQLADDSAVRALMRAIHAAFPDTPPYGGAFADPSPHLTVAEANSDAELDRLEQEIALAVRLPLTLRVDRIMVIEEDIEGDWHDHTALCLAS